MSGSITTFVLTVSDFRAAFPAYANPVAYPDNVLQMNFDNACNYISPQDYGILYGSSRLFAIYKMMAHIMRLNDMNTENDGAAPGLTQDASVGQVRVSLVPPPVKSQFQWWLSLTPYGTDLLALLKMKATGGFYIAGQLGGQELAAFRRMGGRFSGGC